MKSEKELRKHLEDLKAGVAPRCDCAETGHSFECHVGGVMLVAQIEMLEWILEENHEYEQVVEFFAIRR